MKGMETMKRTFAITLALAAAVAAQSPLTTRTTLTGLTEVVAEAATLNGQAGAVLWTGQGTLLASSVAPAGNSGWIAATWTLATSEGVRTYSAASPDGGLNWSTPRETDFELRMRHGRFDPLNGTPTPPGGLTASPMSRLHIVQWMAAGVPAFRQALDAVGATAIGYLPNHSDIIDVDPTKLAELKANPGVRWVGPFHPGYKAFPEDLNAIGSGELKGTIPWNVVVTRNHDLGLKQIVARELAGLGGILKFPLAREGYMLTVYLPVTSVAQALALDGVAWMDRWSEPEADMDIARQFTGAAYASTVIPGGVRGQGTAGEVLDVGCLTSHVDFAGLIQHTASMVTNSHGTSTYGIVFGKGIANPQGLGMMPDGTGITGYYGDAAVTSNRYNYTAQLLLPPYEATFQSNSWGDAQITTYNSVSQSMDNIIFGLDFPILQSQSNTGNQTSRPQAWAKNIISVGGIKHMGTLARTDDNWTGGGSIGPAQDGSQKPDVANFYDLTFCPTSTSTTAYTTSFGGTSGATPITAGAVGILTQMFASNVFSIAPTGATVFARRPHAATIKALLINTATQWSFSGTGADLTRTHQGWGGADIQKAYDLATAGKFLLINETEVLAPFGSSIKTVTVSAGEPELKATLVYADPAASLPTTQLRINNLDLKVTSPTGTIYWGNNGLSAGNASVSGGTADLLNVVENVFVTNPAAGTWTVQVIAAEVNADNHVETAAIDVDFALAVSGGTPPPAGPPDVGQANSLLASLSVNGGLNLNSQGPANGINGPFYSAAIPGGSLSFSYGGTSNSPVVLLLGPLNRNNWIIPGVGSLDIGALGAGNINDLGVILNGVAPANFMDTLSNTGATGARTLSFTMPAIPAGILGTLQAAVQTPTGVSLTAAFQLTVN